jgi:hypothetical protein
MLRNAIAEPTKERPCRIENGEGEGRAITWTRAAAGAEIMRNGTKILVEVSGNVRDAAHRTV